MKKILVLFLLIACCTISAQESDHRGYRVRVGDAIPEFDLEMLDGSRITHKSILGKVTVLQFTASWCVVCRKEMPHLESDVWQRFKNEDFLLVGVDLKEDLEKVKRFQKTMEVTYPMALDIEGDLFYKVTLPKAGVTRNIVLNREGKIIFLTRLYDLKEFEKMIAVIEKEINRS